MDLKKLIQTLQGILDKDGDSKVCVKAYTDTDFRGHTIADDLWIEKAKDKDTVYIVTNTKTGS